MLPTASVSMNHQLSTEGSKMMVSLYFTNHLQNLQYQSSTRLVEVNEDCMSKSFADLMCFMFLT